MIELLQPSGNAEFQFLLHIYYIIYTFKEANSALNDKMILNLSKVIGPLY